MKLNNIAAAEALLRLFNVDKSWEEIEQIGPKYYEPLRSIVQMVKFIDEQRAGELLVSDPQPDMLNAAYEAGYRLAFTQSKCKCCNTIDSMLHIVKPFSAENEHAEVVMTSRNYESTWRELKNTLYGPQPAYTLKDMGEMIIDALSKHRASDFNFALTYEYKPKKNVHAGFSVKSQWGLQAISLIQLNKLNILLQESVREICDPKVELALTKRTEEIHGGKDYYNNKEIYFRSTRYLYLDANVTTASAKMLSEIDFQQIMETFRKKIALLPADTLTLTTVDNGFPTKTKYYRLFDRGTGETKQGIISAEEMRAIFMSGKNGLQ